MECFFTYINPAFLDRTRKAVLELLYETALLNPAILTVVVLVPDYTSTSLYFQWKVSIPILSN